jgi:hypothetical protein
LTALECSCYVLFSETNPYFLHENARMGRIKRASLDAEEQSFQPTTLGDLAKDNVDILCWCNRCSHNSIIQVVVLLGRLGPTFPVPEIGVYMRCISCGAKDVAARPAWPSLGKITIHS